MSSRRLAQPAQLGPCPPTARLVVLARRLLLAVASAKLSLANCRPHHHRRQQTRRQKLILAALLQRGTHSASCPQIGELLLSRSSRRPRHARPHAHRAQLTRAQLRPAGARRRLQAGSELALRRGIALLRQTAGCRALHAPCPARPTRPRARPKLAQPLQHNLWLAHAVPAATRRTQTGHCMRQTCWPPVLARQAQLQLQPAQQHRAARPRLRCLQGHPACLKRLHMALFLMGCSMAAGNLLWQSCTRQSCTSRLPLLLSSLARPQPSL